MKSRLHVHVLSSLLCFFSSSLALTKDKPTLESPNISPEIISSSGKKRIKDFLQTVEHNISLTELNLRSIGKNLSTLESEIQELDKLKIEHETLKNRYVEFLTNTHKEMTKNQKALAEIDEFERKAQKLLNQKKSDTQMTELELARAERKDRETWKKDSQTKIDRVKELLAGVEKNLKSIQAKKTLLINQIQHWNTRQAEYSQTLIKLGKKKKDAERFLASQSPAPE